MAFRPDRTPYPPGLQQGEAACRDLNLPRKVLDVQLLLLLTDWWLYGVAAAGFVASSYGAWIVFRTRILFVVRAADAVRRVYGDDAEEIVDFWYSRSKTIAVQEIRQRLLESHFGLSIYVCDPAGECDYVNDELCELFGLDRDDCKGFGWLEGIMPEDRKRVHEGWIFCVSHRIPYDCDYAVTNKRTGITVEVSTKAYPVTKISGEVLCYVGTVKERK